MFCCLRRKKRDSDTEYNVQRKEMVERFILKACKQTDDDSFDDSESNEVIINDYENQEYEKKPWSAIQWQMTIQTKQLSQIEKDEIKRNLRFGILQNLRPATWFWITDIQNTQMNKHSPNVYQKLKSYESQYDQQIFKSIKTLDKKYSDYAFDVIRALANYDVEIGYVKGVDKIVEYVIQQLDPEKYINLDYAYNQLNRIPDFYDQMAFWITVHILFQIDYRKVFKYNVSFIETEKFSNTLMPSIKTQLEQMNLQLNRVIEMPLLFYYYKFFKKDEFNRLFDAFLYEGEGNYMKQVGLLLQILLKFLKISENVICLFQAESDLTTYINQSLIPYGISQIEKTNQKLMNFLL